METNTREALEIRRYEDEGSFELSSRMRDIARQQGRVVIASLGETTIIAVPHEVPIVR